MSRRPARRRGRTVVARGLDRTWRFGPTPVRAAALLVALASVLALYGATTTPAFAIQQIDVSPLSWTSRDEVVQRLGVTAGVNAVSLSTGGLAARIEELPAVAAANVEVSLPSTLVVTVTERQPILAWRVGSTTFLVDREGKLFAASGPGVGPAPPSAAGLPAIVDLRAASAAVLSIGTTLDPTDLDAATRLASLTPDDVGSRATGLVVRITDTDGFVLATSPASWTAVFGPYSPVLRTPDLIPGQVRLLRSFLFGKEDLVQRVVLADDKSGAYVPRPSGH